MTDQRQSELGSTDPHSDRLSVLVHDARNRLGAIRMGIEALKGVRHDADDFAQVCEMMQKDGVQPLNEIITALADAAREPER